MKNSHAVRGTISNTIDSFKRHFPEFKEVRIPSVRSNITHKKTTVVFCTVNGGDLGKPLYVTRSRDLTEGASKSRACF